jgi:hypothetical protein
MRKRRSSIAGSLFAAGVMVVLSCHPGTTPSEWEQKWGAVPPHRTFPGACGMCHAGGDGGAPRKDLTFDHEKETGYLLEGAHAHAACLRCHNDRGPVTAYVARGCSGCHGDPHASALGSDCQSCHGQGNWQPVQAAARDGPIRFHLIPAHAGPPCASCHVEPGVAQPHVGPAQCGPCHQDGVAPSAERL